MEFSRGKPRDPGNYLTYVKDFASPGWLKPIILTWHAGRWYFHLSDKPYWDAVFLWIGPLPTGKLDDFALTQMEYDL